MLLEVIGTTGCIEEHLTRFVIKQLAGSVTSRFKAGILGFIKALQAIKSIRLGAQGGMQAAGIVEFSQQRFGRFGKGQRLARKFHIFAFAFGNAK
jgi:hypothetical protein